MSDLCVCVRDVISEFISEIEGSLSFCALLKPCCVEMCGMLFVMYGSSVFSSVFAITERSEMGLYDVPMLMSLLGFGIVMMFASFHV